jgi:hypothetical protein
MMAVFLVIKSLGGQTPDRGQRECDHPAITHHVRTTTKRCTTVGYALEAGHQRVRHHLQ